MLVWVVVLIFFFLIFWMVFISFKIDVDVVKLEYILFFMLMFENYVNMIQNYDYWCFVINLVIILVFVMVFMFFVGVLVVYVMVFNLSCYIKDILMWMFLIKMLFVVVVFYLMIFLIKNFFGIFDMYFLIILVFSLINLLIVIWMFFIYFKEILKEIIEVGKMDGVNIWGEIKDILIFLVWGGVVLIVFLCFIFCWNEVYWMVCLIIMDVVMLFKLIEGN